MAKAPASKSAPPAPDLEPLAAIAREAWERQGEAETVTPDGVRWRFYPERSPVAGLAIEARQGLGDAEVLARHVIPGATMGCELAAEALAVTLSGLSAKLASDVR